MVSNMTPFTLFHVLLSLVGIFAGFVVVFGLISARRLSGWTAIFLITAVATSVTGFLFPFHKLLPSLILGILSLIALAVAIYALCSRGLAGAWRKAYVVSSVIALYLNVFELVSQLFMNVPILKVLDPGQSKGPFEATQLTVLILFLALGSFAVKKFRGGEMATI